MKTVVLKFGGTSVGSIDRIKNVAKIISSYKKKKMGVIVVSSAMSGTTNELIKKTKELYPDDQVVFCNGGDRGEVNTPEYNIFINDNNVSFKFDVGGSKTNS